LIEDLYRTSGLLTRAQHKKLHDAAVAFRARAKDPSSTDLYLRELLH
jgi:hypothetical protein